MPEIMPCPECDKKIRIPAGAEGKKIRCPSCEALLLLTEDGLEVARKNRAIQTAGAGVGTRAARKGAPVEDEDTPRSKRRRDDDDEEEDEEPVRKKKKARKGIPLWVWIASGSAAACLLIGIILIVALSGGSKFKKVKEGMTQEEITDLVGKPAVAFGNRVLWTEPPITDEAKINPKSDKSVKEVMLVVFEGGKAKTIQLGDGDDFRSGKVAVVDFGGNPFGPGGGNPFGTGGGDPMLNFGKVGGGNNLDMSKDKSPKIGGGTSSSSSHSSGGRHKR